MAQELRRSYHQLKSMYSDLERKYHLLKEDANESHIYGTEMRIRLEQAMEQLGAKEAELQKLRDQLVKAKDCSWKMLHEIAVGYQKAKKHYFKED